MDNEIPFTDSKVIMRGYTLYAQHNIIRLSFLKKNQASRLKINENYHYVLCTTEHKIKMEELP
jgi:hypothetical protein